MPGAGIGPALRNAMGEPLSRKLSAASIEVVWARAIVPPVASGWPASFVRSSNDPPVLLVSPDGNGTSPPTADNFRVRDVGLQSYGASVAGTPVHYYLGHPSEVVKPELYVFNNHAAKLDAVWMPQLTYNVQVHLVDYVNPTTGARTPTAITAGEIDTMIANVNMIWSQLGVRFVAAPPVTNGTTVAEDVDVIVGATQAGSSNDELTARFPSANIDIFFVNSIWTSTFGLGGAFDAGNAIFPGSGLGTPGVIVAAKVGPNASTPGTARRDVDDMSRTLAHELGHYVLKSAEHRDDELWNLMLPGADYNKRDLDDAQSTRLRNSGVNPATPDQ